MVRNLIPETKALLQQKTIAQLLDVDVRTILRWRAVGEFPPPDFKKGQNMLFWRRETVEKWIEQQQGAGIDSRQQ
jgi:predicted DNA-binding transcriptional regulator AlpA